MLSQLRIREVFEYRDDGRLVRKICNGYEKPVTLGRSKQGYFVRWLDKKCYTEHLLVWIYHHGDTPVEIDHINRVKTDNRIENLRRCDRTLNNANHKLIRKNNTSGYRGVSWSAVSKKWLAQISSGGFHFYLGLYVDPTDAARAYNKAAVEHFGHFAHLNDV